MQQKAFILLVAGLALLARPAGESIAHHRRLQQGIALAASASRGVRMRRKILRSQPQPHHAQPDHACVMCGG